MGYFLNHGTNCETLKRWRMSIHPEIRTWFSPSNSNHVAIVLLREGDLHPQFLWGRRLLYCDFFCFCSPQSRFYLQTTSTWAQKDQLLMAMPRENIITTNLLFQQTAIAHFLLEWAQHSNLVRLKDCFLDQLQEFQAEKRKFKDEQHLTLMTSHYVFWVKPSSLMTAGFFPFWLKRSKTCHSVTILHSHIFAHRYFTINPQKELETPLLNCCTNQLAEDLPKWQT